MSTESQTPRTETDPKGSSDVERRVSELAEGMAQINRQARRLAALYVDLVTPIAQVQRQIEELGEALAELQAEEQAR